MTTDNVTPVKREPVAWERQFNETSKAFEAFRIYRDMGVRTRTTVEVALALGKSTTLIHKWSSKWGWVARSRAFDDDQDRKLLEEQEELRAAMLARHAQIATAFQEKVLKRIIAMDPLELTPANMAQWFDISVKVERLARGEPTEHILNEDVAGQAERLLYEKLEQLAGPEPEEPNTVEGEFKEGGDG